MENFQNPMVGILFFVFFWMLGLLLFICFYKNHRFIKTLRQEHPETWAELGSPTLFLNNSIKNNLSMMKFMSSKKYRELNNPGLNLLATQISFINKTYYIVFFVVIGLFFFNISNQ